MPHRRFGATTGRKAKVQAIVTQTIGSPVGPLQLGATAGGICLLEFSDCRAVPTEIGQLNNAVAPPVRGGNEHLARMADQLARYFEGALTEFTVPLDIVRGTRFQREVWARLLQIPFGRTMSYGQIAEAIGRPGAQRAVGSANRANSIAIVIPCHRVVQSDGKLGGYGGGLWRKQFLLDHEAAMCGSDLPGELAAESGAGRLAGL